MSLREEQSFATQFLNTLSSCAVRYPQDFAPPPQTRPRPVVKTPGVSSLKNSKQKSVSASSSSSASSNLASDITVQIKSLKGSQVFSVTLPVTSKILDLKQKINPIINISPANQRLIFKGKALVDTKTIADYGIVQGDTVHLVQKGTPHNLSQSGLATVKTPQFWVNLYEYLKPKFGGSNDADLVFDEFLILYRDVLGNVTREELERLAKE